MTAQMNDIFRHNGEEYSIAGISEGDLFDPELLDLKPVATCTACYRGYVAYFKVFEDHLVLDELNVNLIKEETDYERQAGPTINGVSPEGPKRKSSFFNNFYRDLNFHLEYSGGLLIANGFIEELYVHMGFHPAWKYTQVIELIFENGILQKELDQAQRMEEIREQILESRDESDTYRTDSDESIKEFINRSFDRSYRIF